MYNVYNYIVPSSKEILGIVTSSNKSHLPHMTIVITFSQIHKTQIPRNIRINLKCTPNNYLHFKKNVLEKCRKIIADVAT